MVVCLLPGTELAFDADVEYEYPIERYIPGFDRLIPRFQFGKLTEKVARFRQINNDKANAHHDALAFANGQIVLLTRLREGQRVTVLQLPASPRTANVAEEQKRGSLVA